MTSNPQEAGDDDGSASAEAEPVSAMYCAASPCVMVRGVA